MRGEESAVLISTAEKFGNCTIAPRTMTVIIYASTVCILNHLSALPLDVQQRPTKFCCCVLNPQLDTQCTTTVNHSAKIKKTQKVHVKEEDSWMVGLCIRPDAKLHDGGFYVSCRSKKCTGVTFRLIKSSVGPQEVFFLVSVSPLPNKII